MNRFLCNSGLRCKIIGHAVDDNGSPDNVSNSEAVCGYTHTRAAIAQQQGWKISGVVGVGNCYGGVAASQ